MRVGVSGWMWMKDKIGIGGRTALGYKSGNEIEYRMEEENNVLLL